MHCDCLIDWLVLVPVVTSHRAINNCLYFHGYKNTSAVACPWKHIRRCTDLEQSCAAYHICPVTSRLLLSLEDILLRTMLPVITVVVPAKWLSFMDTLIALTYLLTYFKLLTYLRLSLVPELTVVILTKCWDHLSVLLTLFSLSHCRAYTPAVQSTVYCPDIRTQ